MNIFSVSAFFPEVKPAHASEQTCTIEACRMTTAAQRGLEKLLQRDGIKGKKITTVRINMRLIGEAR